MNFTDDLKQICLEEEKRHNLLTNHWDKEESRIKQTGEVFTPTELVLEILEQVPDDYWVDGKTALDPACGNGQFLAAVLIVKKYLGHKNLLETIHGFDIMEDNIIETRNRLLNIVKSKSKASKDIVNTNIRHQDFLTYNEVADNIFEWD